MRKVEFGDGLASVGLDRDFVGGDYDAKGIRGVSLDQCVQICTKLNGCIAVSWVMAKSWCWPKHVVQRQAEYREGVVSVILPPD